MPVTDRNVSLSDPAADDLPRTLRRERDAQLRAQQQHHQQQQRMAQPQARAEEPHWSEPSAPQRAVVTAFKVPFFRLMLFFLKAVLAAIPAILLLGAIIWGLGHVLMTFFPWLVKVQILIQVPK